MNATCVQVGKENRALHAQGLASVTFTLHWSDGRAVHEDALHVEKFSVWREADFLPQAIGPALTGMRAGDSLQAELPAGEVTGAWNAAQQITGCSSGFDRHRRNGIVVVPRYGRFYPRGFFHGLRGIVREAIEPARITALGKQSMRVDLNHPLARFDLEVGFHVDEVLSGHDVRGGRCHSPVDDLVRYPGLAAPLDGGADTDYGDDAQGMTRLDERDDAEFYARPRMVQHLDTQALARIGKLYRRLIHAHSDVLDLMASHDSHLQGCSLHSLLVLGMSAEELEANRPASARIVHDLNRGPALPLDDGCLDAVVCTASVEYLVSPQQVFAEVRRVLRPGGVFALTFSNRWFPTKAIGIWSELQEFERVGMVTQWLQHAGYRELHTLSARGWPRPDDDPCAAEMTLSDPVFAVWGLK